MLEKSFVNAVFAKNILKSLFTIVVVSVLTGGATLAYFNDMETSNENTFTAGTLDLQLDGGDENIVKFTVENAFPAPAVSQKDMWRIKNAGTIDGYLNVKNIVVTGYENGCMSAEYDDDTCANPGEGQGELQEVASFRMFVDRDCDQVMDTGTDLSIFGFTKMNALNTQYLFNEFVPAGEEMCVSASFQWLSSSSDNLAQGDSVRLNLSFNLSQVVLP